MPYPFLSEEWLEQARSIRAEYEGQGVEVPHAVRMNLVITEVPFGSGTVDAHVDTSSGELVLDVGHIDSPDLTVTADYLTVKAILVDGNPQAGMQAFMAGKVKIDGDMAKLMALQGGAPNPTAQELARRLKDITE